MKKQFTFILTSLAFLTLAYGSVSEASQKSNAKDTVKHQKVIRFQAAHGPYEVIIKPLKLFKEEVETLTQGKIKVELVIPDTLLESNQAHVTKVFNAVQAGEIQMSQLYSTYMSNFEKDFLALEVPFIFKDHKHAFDVVDGEVGKHLLARLEAKSSLKGLGFTYCGGYRAIGSKDYKLSKLEDFKNLSVHADSFMNESALEELGAKILPKVSKETLMSQIAAGKVPSYVTVYPRYLYWKEFEAAPVLNALDFSTQFTVLVINKKFFNALSKKEQEIVSFAAQKASLKERQVAIENAEEVLKNSQKYGIDLVVMSPAEKDRVKAALESVNWSKKHGISSNILSKIKFYMSSDLSKLEKTN